MASTRFVVAAGPLLALLGSVAPARAQTYPILPDAGHQGTPSYPWQGPSMLQQRETPYIDPGLPSQQNARWAETTAIPSPRREKLPSTWVAELLRDPRKLRFVPAPGMPRGVAIARLGVVAAEPEVDLYLKVPAGTAIPPHWQSGRRELVVVGGAPRLTDGRGRPLPTEDGTLIVPSRAVAELACPPGPTDCLLAVRQLGDLDVHYATAAAAAEPGNRPRTPRVGPAAPTARGQR